MKKNKGKKSPKVKESEVKLEVTIANFNDAIKDLQVATNTDAGGFIAIRPKKGGKVITYVQQTKKGISFYERGKPNWKIADKKVTTQKELDALVKTIESQLENA